ncbi:unnamed protein product [Rangifer tarandus platyrhynchus]|uniref:Uncharacterized protein n=1 Tax=Rangifer tarandus platyrhynchus TaxID=3082113 RepID=A0ABN8ZPQ9_RANTA|nr:unnamed protein product [Rangifer tarandus platyrhynchus]
MGSMPGRAMETDWTSAQECTLENSQCRTRSEAAPSLLTTPPSPWLSAAGRARRAGPGRTSLRRAAPASSRTCGTRDGDAHPRRREDARAGRGRRCQVTGWEAGHLCLTRAPLLPPAGTGMLWLEPPALRLVVGRVMGEGHGSSEATRFSDVTNRLAFPPFPGGGSKVGVSGGPRRPRRTRRRPERSPGDPPHGDGGGGGRRQRQRRGDAARPRVGADGDPAGGPPRALALLDAPEGPRTSAD